jgi:hypothetical protein
MLPDRYSPEVALESVGPPPMDPASTDTLIGIPQFSSEPKFEPELFRT